MVDPITNMPIIILRDKDGQRVLPIWVGVVRGQRHRAADRERHDAAADDARPAAQRHPRSARPASTRSSSRDLKENTFYALIYLSVNGEAMAIDARPSDAIALALRARGADLRRGQRHRPRQDRRLRAGQGERRAAAEVAREPRSRRPGQVQDVAGSVRHLQLVASPSSQRLYAPQTVFAAPFH